MQNEGKEKKSEIINKESLDSETQAAKTLKLLSMIREECKNNGEKNLYLKEALHPVMASLIVHSGEDIVKYFELVKLFKTVSHTKIAILIQTYLLLNLPVDKQKVIMAGWNQLLNFAIQKEKEAKVKRENGEPSKVKS